MRFELPVCARCCFCLPLRYGLLFWGYLQLAFNGLLIISFSFWIYHIVYDYNKNIKNFALENGEFPTLLELLLAPCIILFILLTDFVLTIVFIAGCHKKNVRLIKSYYFYTIVLLVVFTGFSTYMTGTSIYYASKYSSFFGNRGMVELMDAITLFAYIGYEVYIILLIRSELIKLNNGYQFRFVNNAAEAQCTLNMEDTQTLEYKNTSKLYNDDEKEAEESIGIGI